jgi:DNA-directed RNA polymerase subunit RPC12/RpoP
MLASKCAKCGKCFVGWALSVPGNQKCPYCGSKLAIHDDTVDLDVDYASLLQSIVNHPDAWQQSLERTLAVYFREGLPDVISAN